MWSGRVAVTRGDDAAWAAWGIVILATRALQPVAILHLPPNASLTPAVARVAQ
jgi:hypothetical protein